MAKIETKLKDKGIKIFPQAMLNGIDANNMLLDKDGFSSYTAIVDCFVAIRSEANSGSRIDIKIDNVLITHINIDRYYSSFPIMFFIKKGQTISCSYGNGCRAKVFGIKH